MKSIGSEDIPYVDIVLDTSVFIIWKFYLEYVGVKEVKESHQTTLERDMRHDLFF